jgi:SOS-response transcriptional repressor LexA
VSCGCQAAPASGADADADADDAGCSGGESFALRVLGEEMAPEFNHGDIIIIEPDGALHDGSFVLARLGDEWIFRQLRQAGEGWALHALDPRCADRPLPDLAAVQGVVIQKAVPGRRKLSKFYV